MSFNKDQNEPKVPLSNIEKRETSNLLPRYYRTSDNKKFLQSTLDQLIQPGTVKKVAGFIGKENAKVTTNNDIFLQTIDKDRKNYQLEPAAVIKDYLGNVTFFKDYIDHINHINVFDGITNNHARLNKQEFYSIDPHLDWDKFVNFQQYYWLPFGPEPVRIFGQQQSIISEYTVELVDEGDNFAYLFTPNGLTRNPVLTLFRGQTYIFNITSTDHPFSIKTKRTAGSLDRYLEGVEGVAVENGKITFTVSLKSPDVLFYVSENDVDTGGVFKILDIEENTFLDVENDIIGKKTYQINDKNIKLSNGMKLYFSGNVVPEKYSKDFWYVEGVGSAIKLVNEKELEVRSTYIEDSNIFFDDVPFDQLPYSEIGSFPGKPDYVTINRSSLDNNAWSRYNRWFHKDVIEISDRINNKSPNLNQFLRATRPIIEFLPNIKLFNYGIIAKNSVDVIDNFTKDVFSSIEGTLGYNVDGIDLVDGMRVLFNADTDPLVKNKIYKVNYINVQIPGREISFTPETNLSLPDHIFNFTTPHGLLTGNQILYLENGNISIPGLQNRKIYYTHVIDGYNIEIFSDAKLTKKVEIFGLSTGTHKFETYSGLRRQITLIEDQDTNPTLYETVAVRFGKNEQLSNNITGNQGQNYWYNGETWVLAQTKTALNQPPLFDMFDDQGYSYSDNTVYSGSSFFGNKIFSYKIGSGFNDPTLNFPLTYKNINNVGDIVFNFNLINENFSYKINLDLKNKNTSEGYLKISKSLESFKFENGWKTSKVINNQPIVKIYKNSNLINNFLIDVFDNINDLEDLVVKVYVNGKRLNKDKFTIVNGVEFKIVKLINDVNINDIVTIKCFSKQQKNSNGFYEIPISLQNNPLNENLIEFTLGEVIDHVDSIVDNIDNFIGTFPGSNNLRDISDLSSYGTRFVQHSCPLNFSLYHLGNKEINLLKAIEKSQNDYNKFKNSFIVEATNSGIDLDTKRHVDYILENLNKNKSKTQPYYLSDMIPYSAANKIEITILDSRIKLYPITNNFSLDVLSNKAILLYLNDEQLIFNKDYLFKNSEVIEILSEINEGDKLEIYEYESTDGSFCPPTPSKLGIYPKFEPKKYRDNSYLEPTDVIQCHDGSIVIAFNDYRDDLILELEKRIFNNIKVQYNTNIFNIYNYIPGYNRKTDYSLDEFNKILSKYFYQWTQEIPENVTENKTFNRQNSFTFNYKTNFTIDDVSLPGYWRGIYRWIFDTDRPNTAPWEMLGFSIKPKWWEEVYGPSPYTSNNFILWNDLKEGRIREPNKLVRYNKKFIRPLLDTFIPVDEKGNLLSPYDIGLAKGVINYSNSTFVFGDEYSAEAAWRKSSYYPFSIIIAILLMHPNEILGRCFDRSRIVKNLSDQLIYKETNNRLKLQDLLIPSTSLSIDNRIYTAGLINYIVEYITSDTNLLIDQYKSDLSLLTNNISSRIGGFTSKEKYKLILDSRSPNSSGGVFVPFENYYINLNVSSAIKKVVYSGIVITKVVNGFEIRGYNFENPFFNYYSPKLDIGNVIRVGGISETYTRWEENKNYVAGKIVLFENKYYRTVVNHRSTDSFNEKLFAKIPELPILGGQEAILKSVWDKRTIKNLPYGTILFSIQDVVDLMLGYNEYLKDQGFVFENFNTNISAITNWKTSVKEFLFWTTQNWEEGSVISLSPAAEKLTFNSSYSVVENLLDPFYGYKIYRVDGQKLNPEFINVYRKDNEFFVEPYNTAYGIYGATLYLVQKEHVLLIDDITLFNDTIYDKPAGYKQEKIKVLGYITTNWNGGFEIPGFIYDSATINDWSQWKDYNLGDVVKYKEFYYSANKFLPGTDTFNNTDWILLSKKPTPALLPNWDYKSEQFTDFYDLDTDNFDSEQQKVAQHLTGYQKRQYLENIINNDVSQYKFYQGMITEKGTLNSLNKLFDVLSVNNEESLTFDEEWAFRVGEYGALDTFVDLEFVLDESKFKLNPQPLEIVNEIDPTQIDFVYRQRVTDVYIKPDNFKKDIWKKEKLNSYLKTPGYIRLQDVQFNVGKIEDLLTFEINAFNEGDYVWVPFDNYDWNVYRLTSIKFRVLDAQLTGSVVTVIFDKAVNFSIGDLLFIKNSVLEGIYLIDSIDSNRITFKVDNVSFENFEDKLTIKIFELKTVRTSSVDLANNILPQYLKEGETFWADNNGNDLWTVYKNDSSTNFSKNTVLNSNPALNLNFGKCIAIDNTGTVAAIGTNQGIFIYSRNILSSEWVPFQYIDANELATSLDIEIYNFGHSIKFSKDNKFLVVTDPTAKKNYTGEGAVFIFTRLVSGKYLIFGNPFVGSNTTFGLGNAIDIANYNNTYRLAVSTIDKKVIVYEYTSDNWKKKQSITSPIEIPSSFGFDIALGSKTFKLLISDPGINKVLIYDLSLYDPVAKEYIYALTQEIENNKSYINLIQDWDLDGYGIIPNHGFTETINGYPFVYNRLGNVDASGISKGSVYYIRYVDENKIAIFNTSEDAVVDQNRILVNNQGIFKDQRGIETIISASLDFNYSFGNSIDISDSENYIAIGSSLEDRNFNEKDTGKLYVYKFNNEYEQTQILENNFNSPTQQFATKVQFMNDDETLVVFSLFNKEINYINFTDDSIFDFDTTRFFDNIIFDIGRIDIFDRYNANYIYGKSLETNNLESTEYGKNIAVGSNTILVSASRGDQELNVITTKEIVIGNTYKIESFGTLTQQQWNFIAGTNNIVYSIGDKFVAVNSGIDTRQGLVVQVINFSGQVYSYLKPANTKSWKEISTQSYRIDVNLIKKAFLYDKNTSKIINYLDVVDPTQGKIPGIADQEIKFKTYFDPAIYTVATDNLNVDEGMAWKNFHVGMLWWDLSTSRFFDNETGSLIYKSSNWNKLYTTSSVDIYEWVESNVLPSVWDELSGTPDGDALDITGKTKYGSNVYSVKKQFDSVSQTFSEIYYFWVKNKLSVPDIEGRTMNSVDISNLISDPVAYGYPCIALTDSNCISLINLKQFVNNTNTILALQYWNNDNRETNYHSQWKLLSTNKNTTIPNIIENKWMHSLVGKDDKDRLVPDPKLPEKLKYGIEYRPRQSMFVNRIEALKQYIERVNKILKEILVTDIYDISPLFDSDQSPLDIRNEWDVQIDSNKELRFINITQVTQAQLSPIIDDGKIIGVNIINSGKGYSRFRTYQITDNEINNLWYGPEISILGSGINARLISIINNIGEVVDVIVNDEGEGYLDTDTVLTIRPLTVLVNVDDDTLSWSLYSFNLQKLQWVRTKVQAYDVTKYWNYIDWYHTGYNEFTKIDHLLNSTSELIVDDSINIGDLVKIKNVGSGGWILLEKFNNSVTVDYTENFKVVGREKGTIQFLKSIYEPTTGFDKFLLDSVNFDLYPVEELRIIFNVVKNNLLIDNLKIEYLNLFFSNIRYAMQEQTYLDWAFKTSFVKAQHNLGELLQKPNYNNDNLESFEEYINEVKPYHTKIREYISNYNVVEPTKSVVTDFDLLPVIDNNSNIIPLKTIFNNSVIETKHEEIFNYPWTYWLDNLGFEIVNISIIDQGNGYKVPPSIEIEGDQFPGGKPAKAKAYILKGKVNRIDLIDGGSKWVKAPIIKIKGISSENIVEAKAVAIIGNSSIRSNYIKVKFDRISKKYELVSLKEVETFMGPEVSGSKTQFSLKWSPDINIDTYSVFVNGAEELKNNYKLSTIRKIINNETRYSGLLSFSNPPAANSTIKIEYLKDFNHLSATDRINFYYSPQTGQIGKDLSQLMTGVDYGGVSVTGLGFENKYGWDSTPWISDVWDGAIENFDDYFVTVTPENINKLEFKLPYVPENGEIITVYLSKFNNDPTSELYRSYFSPIRIDDLNYLTINQTNTNAVMRSFIGDGEKDVIVIPQSANVEIYSDVFEQGIDGGQNLTDDPDQFVDGGNSKSINLFTIDGNLFNVQALQYGDRLIFRKINSDGSINPKDEDYDTELSGGDLAYFSATGINPDDIILDGDGLITPMTSYAPEEVVPGHIVDSVAIKVYTRPSGGAPNILFKNYIGDGLTILFKIGQYFLNNYSIIVKVNNEIKKINEDYVFNYKDNLIHFGTAPLVGDVVTIISISFNSSSLLDLDFFIADGNTKEYITKAPWLQNLNSTVLVDGSPLSSNFYEIFSTDDTYTTSSTESWRSRAGIRFLIDIPSGSLINYIIDINETIQSASVVKSENIVYQTGQKNYVLTNPVGVNLPYEPNVLIKVNDQILKGPNYTYFTLTDENLIYTLDDVKYQNFDVDKTKIDVILNGNKLNLYNDYIVLINDPNPYYSVDFSNFTISSGVEYQVGDILSLVGNPETDIPAEFLVTEISNATVPGEIISTELLNSGIFLQIPELILTGGSGDNSSFEASFTTIQDFSKFTIALRRKTYVDNALLVVGMDVSSDYKIINPLEIEIKKQLNQNDVVEILSFYNHNILGIERTVDTFNQTVNLNPASLEYQEYVGKLGGIFRLRSTVTSGDFVWVIKNGKLLSNTIDYILKDDLKTIKLLNYLDTTDIIEIIAFTNVTVKDNFGYMQFKDSLNRMHFKRLNKNKSTKLLQSLNQFDNYILVEDPLVLDFPNPLEKRPGILDINGERIEYYIVDGNKLMQLRRGTLGTGIPDTHPVGTIVQLIGPSESIPYKDSFQVVIGNSAQHPNLYINGTMQLGFITNKDEIEVFVGGYRLKKNPYVLYNKESNYPYSASSEILEQEDAGTIREGDVKLPPEFTVSGTGLLQLTKIPVDITSGTKLKVVVVRKQGKLWNDLGKRLGNSNNNIANFINEVSTNWPE